MWFDGGFVSSVFVEVFGDDVVDGVDHCVSNGEIWLIVFRICGI